jgi:hypothetical protein
MGIVQTMNVIVSRGPQATHVGATWTFGNMLGDVRWREGTADARDLKVNLKFTCTTHESGKVQSTASNRQPRQLLCITCPYKGRMGVLNEKTGAVAHIHLKHGGMGLVDCNANPKSSSGYPS